MDEFTVVMRDENKSADQLRTELAWAENDAKQREESLNDALALNEKLAEALIRMMDWRSSIAPAKRNPLPLEIENQARVAIASYYARVSK